MADPNQELRIELEAALAALEPKQLDGLDDLTRATMSSGAIDAMYLALSSFQHRRDLILALINALNDVVVKLAALIADGYPALPRVTVSGPLLAEIQREIAAIASVSTIFEGSPLASKISFEIGAFTDKET